MRRLTAPALVLAILAALLVAFSASSSAPLSTAAPVPTCIKPTGSISNVKLLAYMECRSDRLEALGENQHAPAPPAPTVTETVTVTPTPTPSPTPTPTPTVEPTPTPGGYPNASNTGVPAGTTLTTVNGNVTLSTAGQVYADKQVNGCILVTAPDVVIRRVRVICEGFSAIYNESTNLTVEDTEIDCGTDGVWRTGLGWRNYTARRVNAHGCENIMWAEENVLVVDSYLHDPVPFDPVRDPHTDSVQIPNDAFNIVLRHNRILGGYIDQTNFGNAAVTMGSNVSGVVVEDNVLAGGGYTLYCEQGGAGDPQPHYIDNRFSTMYVDTVGGFGPATDCGDEIQSGNVIHETGEPITLH